GIDVVLANQSTSAIGVAVAVALADVARASRRAKPRVIVGRVVREAARRRRVDADIVFRAEADGVAGVVLAHERPSAVEVIRPILKEASTFCSAGFPRTNERANSHQCAWASTRIFGVHRSAMLELAVRYDAKNVRLLG